jgi:hypothetical protein
MADLENAMKPLIVPPPNFNVLHQYRFVVTVQVSGGHGHHDIEEELRDAVKALSPGRCAKKIAATVTHLSTVSEPLGEDGDGE